MKKLLKKVVSFLLAIAMVFSLTQGLDLGTEVVNAEENPVYVTLHFKNVDNWDAPAIQYWGGSSTEVSDYAQSGEITGWNVTGYTMTAEGDSWYKITLKGDFEGYQLLDFSDPSGYGKSTSNIKDDDFSYCTGTEATNLYIKRDSENNYATEYFLDADLTKSISTLESADSDEDTDADEDTDDEDTTEDTTEETTEDTSFYGTVNAESSNVTIHFDNSKNYSKVYAYVGTGDNWDKQFGDWPGKELSKDDDGYYTFTLENEDLSDIHFIYSDGNGSQTGNLLVKPKLTNEEYYVTGDEKIYNSELDEDNIAQYLTLHYFVPTNWNWSQPALQYWGGTSTEVSTENLGEISGWGGVTGYALDVDTTTTTGTWYKITLKGDFQGFQFLDFANPSSNTAGSGYASTMTYATETTATDMFLKRDDSNNYGIEWYLDRDFTTSIDTIIPEGTPEETTMTIHFKNYDNWSEVAAYACQGGSWSAIPGYEEFSSWPGKVVTADEDGWYTVSFTKNMDTLDIIFNNNNNGSQTDNICITPTKANEEYWVVDKSTYLDYQPTTFTMHYYTTDWSDVAAYITEGSNWSAISGYTAAASWPGVSIKKDSKNANWYTVTVTKTDSQLNIIFNNNGGGAQTDDVCITPTKSTEERWITGVKGSTTVTDVAPEGWVASDANDIYEDDNAAKPDRYVVVEYIRPDGDYDDWNIYCWDSGWGSKTEQVYSEEVNGKHYIIFPVKDSTNDFNIGFCMRHSTTEDAWAEKDGGDHHLDIPAGQTVVHAVFTQGEGITYVYPYNTGYEMDGENDTINFYYRDDSLVLTNKESSLSDVKVVVNGTSYNMTYNADNERYEAAITGLTTGDYAYYYVVGGEKQLDAFNADTTEFNGEECSVISYKKFETLGISASMSAKTMDYDDSDVLTVALTGDSDITVDEILSIKADLSELGLGDFEISKDLMAGSVSALDSVATGTKTIPVTMTDIYGNTYKTSTTVELVKKTSSDFDWDEAVIYFTVTDRFFDGDESNNTGVEGEDDVDKTGSLSYHGGDFAGLEEKLDYLQDLGVNTIWITPIVSQSDITTTKDGETIESTGYHGYWASDFTSLNGHLGTEEEFQELTDAVHAKGMKLMVDVVLNHAGYNTTDYFNNILAVDNGDGTVTYKSMIRDESNTISGDNVYDSLSNLPDFVTEDSDVREQLIDWQTNWVEKFGIDYFRVDTVKHVDTETWEALKNELTEIDPDFKMIGEYSGGGYTTLSSYEGAMDSLLDFDYNDQAQSFVKGNISSVESFLETRNANINNTSTLGAFLSSHDENGLLYKLINADGYSQEEAEDLFKVAAALQLTSKGQVVIYYGEEIGLTGADNYPYQTNRYDFDWDEAAAQAKDSDSMLNHYKKLLSIRKQYSKLLAKGTRTGIATSDANGTDVFSRSYGDETMYVALNIKDAQSVTFATGQAEGTVLKDLYGNKTYEVAEDGTVTVEIPAAADGGAALLVKDEQMTKVVTVRNKIVKTIKSIFDKIKQIIKNPSNPNPGNGNNNTVNANTNSSVATLTTSENEASNGSTASSAEIAQSTASTVSSIIKSVRNIGGIFTGVRNCEK